MITKLAPVNNGFTPNSTLSDSTDIISYVFLLLFFQSAKVVIITENAKYLPFF